jgi:dihydroorotase
LNIYIQNIRVINPYEGLDEVRNLWIKDGIICHSSKEAAQTDSDTKIIDGTNLVASPGLFDMHVHLREPGFEYKEDIKTGTNCAANGGFTGLVCMPNTDPSIDNATVISYIKEKSQGLVVDVHVAGAITKNREGKLIAPMLEMIKSGAVLFTDDGASITDTEVMRRAFDYAASHDLLISQHCEDTHLTHGYAVNETPQSYKLGLKGYPSVAEDIMVARDLMLANYLGNRRYHVSHISTKGAVKLVREAKANGQRVSAEVTPHHFFLDDSHMEKYDTNYKMNPPLRGFDDLNEILEGLKDGTIDCIASDHAPHALHEKDVEFELAPNGILGLESALGIAITALVEPGHLTISQLIEKMSVNPRNICGLDKISFENGSKANISIFNPTEEWTYSQKKSKSKSLNSPFDGYVFKGKAKMVINNNKLVESTL